MWVAGLCGKHRMSQSMPEHANRLGFILHRCWKWVPGSVDAAETHVLLVTAGSGKLRPALLSRRASGALADTWTLVWHPIANFLPRE